jgi:hypothetical protein
LMTQLHSRQAPGIGSSMAVKTRMGLLPKWDNVYCSITFNSYSHASHPQKPTKKFVSHSITRVIYERVRRIQKSVKKGGSGPAGHKFCCVALQIVRECFR